MLIHSVDGCFSIFRALTYYKEVEHMKSLDFTPDLLLLHDWPVTPPHVGQSYKAIAVRKASTNFANWGRVSTLRAVHARQRV